MLAFIIRRLLQSAIVMLVVALVAFALFRYVGDPVNMLVALETSPEEKARIRQRLGLNDPVGVQFARFVANAVRGDFGISYRQTRPVEQLIAERLPATLELSLAAALVALGLGVPLGVYTGLSRDSGLSRALQTVSLIGVSLPTFVTGILLILLFSVMLHWLPAFGRGQVLALGWWTTGLLTLSGVRALIMPALTLGVFQMTLIMRLVRSEMIEVLRTDYIKFARARGLRDRTVHFGHALRNTLVPVITIAALQLGSLIAFSIIVETVFQWPGMGSLFIQAVEFSDIPVMAAYLVLVAFLFVVINLIADLLCYAVDPRLRVDRAVAGQHTT